MSDLSLLPQNKTPWETAQSLTSAEQHPLPTGLLAALWDPWRCEPQRLSSLAADLSVDIWDDAWPDEKKRSVIAAAPAMHRLKGTEEGIRRHVAVVDAELRQVVVPPQGVHLAPPLSAAQWDAYLRQMPQLRLKFGPERGRRNAGVFLDVAAWDVEPLTINDGPKLYGRKAVLRRNGVDTPLEVATVVTTDEARSAVDFETVHLPGDAGGALVLDIDAWDVAAIEAEAARARPYTFALDRSYRHDDSELSLSTLQPGFDPLDVRYERVSDVGHAGAALALDVDGYDVNAFVVDLGGQMLADRLYLHDPAVAVPLMAGFSFWDQSRWDMPDFHADALVHVPQHLPPRMMAFDLGGWGETAATIEDNARAERARDAIVVSKAFRDKVFITFQTKRPRTLGDGLRLDGSTTLGGLVAATI